MWEGDAGSHCSHVAPRAPCRVIDELYVACELDCNLGHVHAILKYLQDAADDFEEVRSARSAQLQQPCPPPPPSSSILQSFPGS